MNQWDKWKKVIKLLEEEISTEKGEFSLFALFRRAEAPDKYDLLVSAPWIEADKKQSLDYLVEKVRKQLTKGQLLSLSRIVLLEKDNPILKSINKAIKVKHGSVEVKDSSFSGIQISQACISTSSANPPIVR